MVSSAGGRKGYVRPGRHNVYRAIKRKCGNTKACKTKAAKIANAGSSPAARSRMARKAARTRRSKR
jgi:hypothetical protein